MRRRDEVITFDCYGTLVRAYKPAQRHFLTAREKIAGGPWLHAAQSDFHDVVPARALGIPIAWINRKREAAANGGRARDLRGN